MKRGLAIFMMSIYLLSTSECYQALKLPFVFTHFFEHRALNKNMSFLDFLDLHYFKGHAKDNDYSKDQQLPFKTTCPQQDHGISLFIPMIAFIQETEVERVIESGSY